MTVDTEEAMGLALGPLSGLARNQNISVYDARCLELALRRGLPLATLDARLGEATRHQAIPMVGERGWASSETGP